MGEASYSKAKEILITADGGGSNGSMGRLWKLDLQRLASWLRIAIHIRPFPPVTSKWNKVENRMFCHITEHWRGSPLPGRMELLSLS